MYADPSHHGAKLLAFDRSQCSERFGLHFPFQAHAAVPNAVEGSVSYRGNDVTCNRLQSE